MSVEEPEIADSSTRENGNAENPKDQKRVTLADTQVRLIYHRRKKNRVYGGIVDYMYRIPQIRMVNCHVLGP